ncbi:MAG: AtpZ/AtpI family protein [Sphingomicrobium sp.]
MAEDETDEVPKLPPDARLGSLDERLDQLQRTEAKRTAKPKPDASYQAGQLVLSNLIGAPAGGFIIGFVLDKWLGTQPWLLLIMLFLGFVGGFMNVMRISKTLTGSRPDERE